MTEGEGRLAEYVLRRWRFIALTCASALVIAAMAVWLLPRRYTAVARIVIDPPAGTDPRASVAVSPIYLESLRSYEHFAASDELFLRAAQKFGLRGDGQSIDRLKKSVLKVGLPRNTKVLEIRVEWKDPRSAHQLAIYLAEETVKLSQSVSRGSEEDSIRELERQVAGWGARVEAADRAVREAASRGSIEQLKGELQTGEYLRSTLKRRLIEEEADRSAGDETPRAPHYRKELADVEREIQVKSARLAQLKAVQNAAREEQNAARLALRSATTRMDDARASAAYRGERLRVLDPGVVPERPSYPNVPLILSTALFGGLVLALLFVALEAGLAGRKPVHARADFVRLR